MGFIRYAGFASLTLFLIFNTLAATEPFRGISYTPLLFENNFKAADEVVKYYVERDADAFVWSGFDAAERKAFTFWNESPVSETFLVASRYEVGQASISDKNKNEARVTVKYDVIGTADSYGAFSPAKDRKKEVTFILVLDEKRRWKIQEPQASQIVPIVLKDRITRKSKKK